MVKRRRYSKEFNTDEIRLVGERGGSVAVAAIYRDVHENVLRKSVRSVAEDAQHAGMFR